MKTGSSGISPDKVPKPTPMRGHGSTLIMQCTQCPPAHAKLGPQCLSCRKRRVKCDSATPTCRRCGRDNLQCPGYEKRTRIIQYVPVHSNQVILPPPSSRKSPEQNLQEEQNSLSVQTSLPIRTIHAPGENKDIHCLLDSIRCYNRSIVSNSRFAHPLLSPNLVQEGTPWHLLPTLLQHMFIITFRSLHAAHRRSDPLSSSMICHYRSLGLQELRQSLFGAAEAPNDIALGAILLLMGVDVLSAPNNSWSIHFNAARKVIVLRGGVSNCLKNSPALTQLLVNYTILDVFSGTTCRIVDLFPDQSTMMEHWSYLELLPQLDSLTLAQASACPLPILQAIVRTNLLRAALYFHGNDQMLSQTTQSQDHISELENILQSVKGFDSKRWALQTLNSQQVGPKKIEDIPPPTLVAGLSSIGRLYQSAAFLYAIMSCLGAHDSSHVTALHDAQETIWAEVCTLFGFTSHPHDTPLHKLIWKCLEWPLFVSLYTDVIRNDMDDDADASLRRARKLADRHVSRRLSAGITHLEDIRALRKLVFDRSWTWEDGFSSRCAFGV